jgi:hypothetical protein
MTDHNLIYDRNLNHFNSVLGAHRGGALDPEVFARILNNEGLPEATRILGALYSQHLHNPEIMDVLCEYILDTSYIAERPCIRGWLRSIGVRPRWALNLIDCGGTTHFFPRGHLLVEAFPEPISTACGANLDRASWNHVRRGACDHSQLCQHCALTVDTHPELLARDRLDPLPAPVLDTGLKQWKQTQTPTLQRMLLAGLSVPDILEQTVIGLDDLAVTWAAHVLSRYPQPNAMRALRANSLSTDVRSLALDAKKLADLALDESAWTQLLRQHLHNRYDHAANILAVEGVWAETLHQVATNHVLAERLKNSSKTSSTELSEMLAALL